MPEILGISPPLLPDVARALSDLIQLPQLTQFHVRALKTSQSKDRLLRWVPNVEQAIACLLFHPGTSVTVGQLAAKYSEGDMAWLEACSEALHLAATDKDIPASALTEIRDKIHDLARTLKQDRDLDPGLRDLLLIHISDMFMACNSYPLTGPQGIRDAYNRTVGAMLNVWPDVVEKHKTSPGTWAKAAALMTAVAALIGSSAQVAAAIASPHSAQPAIQQVINVPAQLAAPAVENPPATTRPSAHPLSTVTPARDGGQVREPPAWATEAREVYRRQ
jgi:hypothetical protein